MSLLRPKRVAILSQRNGRKIFGNDPDEPLILELRSRGWDVLAAVPWRDVREVDWTQVAACIIRSTWDYWEDLDAFMAALRYVSGQGVLVLNDPEEIVSWNAEKTYLRGFASRGVPVIPTVYVEAAAPGAEVEYAARVASITKTICDLAQLIPGGVVVKPTISGGSADTYRVQPEDCTGPFDFEEDAVVADLSRHGRATDFGPTAPAPLPDDGSSGTRWPRRRFESKASMVAHVFHRRACMIQPFVDTVQTVGEFAVFYFGPVCSHGIVKRANGGDFRVQPQFGGANRPVDSDELAAVPGLLSLCADVVTKQLTVEPLYARLDVVLVPHSVYVACAAVPPSVAEFVGLLPASIVSDRAMVPALIELEVIEPYLYYESAPPGAAAKIADVFERQLAERTKGQAVTR